MLPWSTKLLLSESKMGSKRKKEQLYFSGMNWKYYFNVINFRRHKLLRTGKFATFLHCVKINFRE